MTFVPLEDIGTYSYIVIPLMLDVGTLSCQNLPFWQQNNFLAALGAFLFKVQWIVFKNQQSPIYVVNWHFSRYPE